MSDAVLPEHEDELEEPVEPVLVQDPPATGPVFTQRQMSRMRDLLARLSGARRSQHFYPAGHPAVRQNVADLMESIDMFHEEGLDVPVTFFENEVLLGQQLLPEDSVLFDQLIRDIASSSANGIVFGRGLTVGELERAMPILAADQAGIDAAGGLEKAVQAADIPHVVLTCVASIDREESGEGDEGGRQSPRQSYNEALGLMREMEGIISSNGVVPAERVRHAARGLVTRVLANPYAMLELSGLKDYDEYTFFHSVNVAILSLALGSSLSTDRRFLNSLGVGALMHDIGKLALDSDVLKKPGALTTEEWEYVRRHPLQGAEVAATMPGLDRSSIVIILEHHMRYDLAGYPQPHPKRRQHIASRVVAVADAYDAMTSHRPYSLARLQDEAMEVLAKNAGSAFDPVLVRLFVQMLGVYPPRSVVRLDTGETGVVVSPGDADVLRPLVRVFADPSGAIMASTRDVDLSEDGVSITGCIDPSGLNVDVEDYL